MGKNINNVLQGHPLAVDALYRAGGAAEFSGGELKGDAAFCDEADGVGLAFLRTPALSRRRLRGTYTSPEITAEFPFSEVLPSWNIRVDEYRQSYTVHLRVADERGWSPWFYFGGGGSSIHSRATSKVIRETGWGKVKIDYLLLDRPASRFQYRVTLESAARTSVLERSGAPLLRRFFVAYSNMSGDETLWRNWSARAVPPSGEWARTIDVPFRDQRNVPHRTMGREICCPTCVAMVLDSHGIRLPTLAVAGQAWCGERRIYGIWPRAAQTASRYGLEAWVQRFRTGDDVKRLIAAGVPVMASIRVKEGELSNARYRKTAGHLILIRGFTADGKYVVNDPYSPGPGGAEIVYSEEDMTKVWFDRGGVGIVIRQPVAAGGVQK